MTFAKTATALTTLVLLSACGGASDSSGPLSVGPGASLGTAEASLAALGANVSAIETAQGITSFGDVQRGTVTYSGIIGGTAPSSLAPGAAGFTYVADVNFTSNLPSKDLTASITNVVTDVPGFENPQGSALLSGSILNTPEAAIGASGSGRFSQGSVETEWVLSDVNGYMVGTDGAAMRGTHSTQMTVTAGSLSSTSFRAGGAFYAVRD